MSGGKEHKQFIGDYIKKLQELNTSRKEQKQINREYRLNQLGLTEAREELFKPITEEQKKTGELVAKGNKAIEESHQNLVQLFQQNNQLNQEINQEVKQEITQEFNQFTQIINTNYKASKLPETWQVDFQNMIIGGRFPFKTDNEFFYIGDGNYYGNRNIVNLMLGGDFKFAFYEDLTQYHYIMVDVCGASKRAARYNQLLSVVEQINNTPNGKEKWNQMVNYIHQQQEQQQAQAQAQAQQPPVQQLQFTPILEQTFHTPQQGQGLGKKVITIPEKTKDLLDRMQVLISAKKQGHNNTFDELSAILSKLLDKKVITKNEYKKLLK